MFRGNQLKCVDILCSKTSESCHSSCDNQVKIVLHLSSPHSHGCKLNSASPLSNIFSLCCCPALTELLSKQMHQTPCWCPVCWTNYGHLCSFYGNLCPMILWSFLHAVVLNMHHNGSYVACCVYLHDINSPLCMFTVILLVMFWS